jgi:hypothetical protein
LFNFSLNCFIGTEEVLFAEIFLDKNFLEDSWFLRLPQPNLHFPNFKNAGSVHFLKITDSTTTRPPKENVSAARLGMITIMKQFEMKIQISQTTCTGY